MSIPESVINVKEIVLNTMRKFGSNKKYYPCLIKLENKKTYMAFFTKNQIKIAVERANKNKEDIELLLD